MKLLHEHYDVLDGGCGTFAVAQNPIVGDGSIRVLQVDDDVSILEISKLMLKDMNECFEIDSASSVDEAYKKLEFCNYDVVISDYEMPQKNGLEFLRELREQNNQIPFVLFTGRGREEVAITALNLGADAYINKQGNPETVYGELSHALNKAVERRVALKLLVESELKYRNVVQNTLVGIAILEGIPPRIVFANSAMGKIFGLSPEAIVALSSEEIVRRLYPDDRDHFTTSFERRIEGKEVESSLEFRGIRQDGSVIWLELCTTLIDYGGKKAVQAVFLDITERKKAEESLRQERDKLEALTANIGAGLVIISKDYKILWINDYLKQVTGASEGDPCFSSFNTCTSICPDCGPMKIFKGASIDRREYCNQTESINGRPVWVELITTPLRDKDGNVFAALELSVDINEKKEALVKLRESRDRIDLMNEKLRVVGSLTRHDVSNKLCAVNTYVHVLKTKHKDQPDVVERLKRIEQAVAESAKIFEFAKMYEQLGVENLTFVDVGEAVDGAVALFSDLKLKVDNDCHGIRVLSDSFLKQMFYNLIDNTLKHGEKATAAKVYCEREALGGLRLIYEDNGVGISHENKKKLFSEGFSTGGSTGFGLFLIKKMMDVYGWTINEEGEPGEGIKFSVTVPGSTKDGAKNFQLLELKHPIKIAPGDQP